MPPEESGVPQRGRAPLLFGPAMKLKRKPDTPKTIELWVKPVGERRFMARTLTSAYRADTNRAVNDLDRFLRTRWLAGFAIETVEIK